MSDIAPCPRRQEVGPWDPNGPDTWREDGTCSFCGSLHPDRFMERLEDGEQVIPTDKSYKAYVGQSGGRKFYFVHLSDAQKTRFYEMHQTGKLNIGHPGHFYALPYFMKRVPWQP